ncbi:MAG: hypothetical protein ACLQVM_04815 [Terriglobia bacterium]
MLETAEQANCAKLCFGALQAAEKLLRAVILRSRRRRRISHCLENTQSEILRFAQNDSVEGFFRSLLSSNLNPAWVRDI